MIWIWMGGVGGGLPAILEQVVAAEVEDCAGRSSDEDCTESPVECCESFPLGCAG